MNLIGESKAEAGVTKEEELAIMLACSHEVSSPPGDRLEMLAEWQAKRETVRHAYRLRAKRLLKAWRT